MECKQPKLQTLSGFPDIPMQIMKFHFVIMDVIFLCALMCAKSKGLCLSKKRLLPTAVFGF